MTGISTLTEWMRGYVRAWTSNDPDDIRALFTDDAEYFTAPFLDPWRGLPAIVENWLGDRDEPGSWTFDWQVLTISGDIAVITGTTVYPAQATYSNLWVLRFATDGRCSSYTEWYMDRGE